MFGILDTDQKIVSCRHTCPRRPDKEIFQQLATKTQRERERQTDTQTHALTTALGFSRILSTEIVTRRFQFCVLSPLRRGMSCRYCGCQSAWRRQAPCLCSPVLLATTSSNFGSFSDGGLWTCERLICLYALREGGSPLGAASSRRGSFTGETQKPEEHFSARAKDTKASFTSLMRST